MLGKNKSASVNMKGICFGKIGEFVRRGNFSKNLLDMVNNLVKSLRIKEEIEYEKFGASTKKNDILERKRK